MASELKVDKIYNKSGDGDSGVVLSTNDVVATHIAGSEKARIDANGDFMVAKTSVGAATAGFETKSTGYTAITRDGGQPLEVRRLTSNGVLVDLRKDSTSVGSISALGGERIALHTGTVGIEFNPSNQVNPSNGSGGLDNTLDLGASGTRWDDVYATNGTIQTSDENEKQNIASFTTKELAVATKLSALFKTFKWKNKVTEKSDKARTHSGIIAQTVKTTFASEGLDAANYGLFTSTTWTDDDGKEQTRMGIRYPELFSFIFGSIEARLTALEAK